MLNKRHEALLDLLKKEPEMSVGELTDRLGVSPATVRRDLSSLAKQGLVHRLRGGVTATAPLGIEPAWTERRGESLEMKCAIARLALEMVEEGQVIALDVGTTTLELAKLLHMRADLMVFTASVPIAELLAPSRPTVYLVGGRVRPREMGMVGPLAREIVGRFHYDTFFLAAAGWSVEEGLMDYSIEDVEIKQAFMKASNQVVALVDSSKYGRTALMSIAELGDVDLVITDSGLAKDARAELTDIVGLSYADAVGQEGSWGSR